MSTTISATELARNLSDILNRVRYRGESFVVERKGEVVAEIRPGAQTGKVFTTEEIRRELAGVKVPEGFADVLEQIRSEIPPVSQPPEWP